MGRTALGVAMQGHMAPRRGRKRRNRRRNWKKRRRRAEKQV